MKDTCCDIKRKPSFVPFIGAIGVVCIYTLVHQFFLSAPSFMVGMNDFMGLWFLLFGAFKLYDLRGFAHHFTKYDIIANRIHRYGYLFPFLEIVLGIAYLIDAHMLYRIPINTATLVIMGVTAIGVFHALRQKKDVHCVCMGTYFPLPMTISALIENISMALMAVVMIVWMIASTSVGSIQGSQDSSQIDQQVNCH